MLRFFKTVGDINEVVGHRSKRYWSSLCTGARRCRVSPHFAYEIFAITNRGKSRVYVCFGDRDVAAGIRLASELPA